MRHGTHIKTQLHKYHHEFADLTVYDIDHNEKSYDWYDRRSSNKKMLFKYPISYPRKKVLSKLKHLRNTSFIYN